MRAHRRSTPDDSQTIPENPLQSPRPQVKPHTKDRPRTNLKEIVAESPARKDSSSTALFSYVGFHCLKMSMLLSFKVGSILKEWERMLSKLIIDDTKLKNHLCLSRLFPLRVIASRHRLEEKAFVCFPFHDPKPWDQLLELGL